MHGHGPPGMQVGAPPAGPAGPPEGSNTAGEPGAEGDVPGAGGSAAIHVHPPDDAADAAQPAACKHDPGFQVRRIPLLPRLGMGPGDCWIAASGSVESCSL
jgi:hypothetical protein